MMPVLTIGNTKISYAVRYSAHVTRKRIVVTPDGVEVVAPAGTGQEGADGILNYLIRKRRWVFDSVREINEKHRRLLIQRYASGAKLQYRGRWLMLTVQPAPVEQVEIQCRSKFRVLVPESMDGVERLEALAQAFDAWLHARAQRDLLRFGRRYAPMLDVEPKGYRLSNSKARWGSCGRDGVVRVHWRLSQAPAAAMEYVVAHELVHLMHRHHGVAFWNALGVVMPDWAERKRMLESWEADHRAL